jgi:hypothetical protein
VPLNEARGLHNTQNRAALLRNVDLMAGHIKDQDAALGCYEAQTTADDGRLQ